MWIDPHECTGAGTCEQIAPEVFTADGDGTWCVKQEARFFGTTTVFDGKAAPGHGPVGRKGIAVVPHHLVAAVVEAAEQCPGECIYLEV